MRGERPVVHCGLNTVHTGVSSATHVRRSPAGARGNLMTVISISMLLIAIINVVLMGVVVAMLMRVNKLLDDAERIVQQHGVPLIEKLNDVAEDVKNISKDARTVELRIAALTGRVMDNVEPPVRTAAALLAGVRAGVGRFFDGGRDQADAFVHGHTRKG